jgi:manganese/iron transport system permease protein
VGALLVTVVLTVPAATIRLFEPALRTQQLLTFALAAVEGLAAIWIADGFNVGPGPAMAVLGALVYAAAAVAAPRRTQLAPA